MFARDGEWFGSQALRKPLGMLHRGGTHQLRASDGIIVDDLRDDGAQFAFLGAVNHIWKILSAPKIGFSSGVDPPGIVLDG